MKICFDLEKISQGLYAISVSPDNGKEDRKNAALEMKAEYLTQIWVNDWNS
jgi:hypothetical protein